MTEVVDRDEYLVGFDAYPDEEAFMARCKVVPGTYAHRIVSSIYETLTKYSLDMKREYLLYFKPEYDCFSEFAMINHEFKPATAEKLDRFFDLFKVVLYFKPHQGILYEEKGHELLKTLLGEFDCEN